MRTFGLPRNAGRCVKPANGHYQSNWGGSAVVDKISHAVQVIKWLEQYLTSKDVSVVVVTHDRAFMEAVCTSVLELEAGEVNIHNFGGPGSYDRFRQVCAQPSRLAYNSITNL